ncbi:MAG TPA: DUF5668 domain-containing protein [Bryobacteraceae bacterium]|nr:DUF5668 domain-containing protein [Bryobacteraceae bacterium]
MNMQHTYRERGLVGPVMMILVGSVFLLHQFVPWLSFNRMWPLLLIGGGVTALLSRR